MNHELIFSLAGVLAMEGWVHLFAFDLLVGAWICRDGRRDGERFYLIVLRLPVILLLGPAGFLLFQVVRAILSVTGAGED